MVAAAALALVLVACGPPAQDTVLVHSSDPALRTQVAELLPKLAEMGNFFPREVRSGACQEVVKTEGFSLHDYPVLTCCPQDGGPFMTLPMVFSKNPVTGKGNCGMYRLQVFDERTTIGMVRLYAKEASQKLDKLFKEIGQRDDDTSKHISDDFAQSAKNQLDAVFSD